MRLASDRYAATEARRFARQWAAQHAVTAHVINDIELVVAELVSNAVLHGQPPIDFELSQSNDGTVRGEIRDGARAAPQPSATSERGGFGLRIVDARTSCWGSTTHADGKQVWFEIASPTI